MTRCPDPRKRGSGLFFCNKGNEGRGEASAPTEVYLAVRRGGALPLPRATARVAPTEGVQEVRGERNTSVTASPCQPPLGKGAEGTGVRIATASVRTGFAMTGFFMGCGARLGGGITRGAVKRGVGEISEAPPVAEEASRFRGSAPIGGHNSGRESVGTTVGNRRPLRRGCKGGGASPGGRTEASAPYGV